MAEKKETAEFNVDRSMDEIEEINKRLAEKDIPLGEALELYKKGTELAGECKKHLEGVEQQLKLINGEG